MPLVDSKPPVAPLPSTNSSATDAPASEELGDRPAVLDDGPGASDGVEVGGVEGDAHVVVDGRREVGGGDRVVLDVAAIALGGPRDLAMQKAAPRHRHR